MDPTLENEKAPPVEKETRFAVVMYGGVSLAIYIYGVAQELYKMVRATARQIDNEDLYFLEWGELTDTEKVYRKLGKSLKTKFVVDILSGTSAGGINAIYLAKALANYQSIKGLKNMWLDQGDIATLLNDQKSKVDGLEVQSPPSSLLNSERMYFYLLKALHEMDGDKPEIGPSPFVEELDLYITATDIRGLIVDLPVANAHVHESRFRNVFRFHYSTMDAAGNEKWNIKDLNKKRDESGNTRKECSNDFKKVNNPFLAYVARCTSSFPFAFEPMQLQDIKSVLHTEDFEEYKYRPETWSGFYKEYEKIEDDFPRRSFGDGGYLDNKPFSYATEALLRRRSDQPVDRKLIYIDPSPEHPRNINVSEKPDAFQNVLAALLSIPRYEPIREDLEKVVERNQLIHHVNHIVSLIDHIHVFEKKVKTWQTNGEKWAKKRLDKELLDWFGFSYVAYHQLRVASVLDNLHSAMLRAFNWNETGESAEKLHDLIEGWRKKMYTTVPEKKEVPWSENDILFRLDMTWRMRRLQFLQNIINSLLKAVYALDTSSEMEPHEREKLLKQAQKILKTSQTQWDIFDEQQVSSIEKMGIITQKRKEAADQLISIKKNLNDVYAYLRARGRKLRSQSLLTVPQSDAALQVYVDGLLKLKKQLEEPVEGVAGKTRLDDLAEKARVYLQSSDEFDSMEEASLFGTFDMIEEISSVLAEHPAVKKKNGYIYQSLALTGKGARSAIVGSLPEKGKKDSRTLHQKSIQKSLQKCLFYYYERFEYYDMSIFPVYYGTGVEESDEVEIIRISPEDAIDLIAERDRSQKKLAGTTLANFGAFFAREWRENDMMWGRLDAAECLIKALQLESPNRKELIEEIHRTILQDELTPRDQVRMDKAKNEVEKAESEKILVDKYKSRYGLKDGQAKWLYKAIHRLSDPEKITENFRHGYSINREFPPKETLLAGSRAMRVFGDMLTGLSSSHKYFSTPAKWITSTGSIVAGILTVTLPNSLGNLLVVGYWIGLLYLFEFLLGCVGWLSGAKAIQQIGISSFVITFLAHLILTFMNKWLAGKVNPKLVRGVLSVFVVLFVIGGLFLGYLGLLSLGFLKIPDGLIGQWLHQITTSCPKTVESGAALFCRPAE